jgi:hypothetical protein
MNRVVAQHAGHEVYVVLDNLTNHKPNLTDLWLTDLWLKRRPSVHFHFTRTKQVDLTYA